MFLLFATRRETQTDGCNQIRWYIVGCDITFSEHIDYCRSQEKKIQTEGEDPRAVARSMSAYRTFLVQNQYQDTDNMEGQINSTESKT